MDSSMLNDFINFIKNSSDGQKIAEHSELHSDDISKLVQEILPKMTDQVQSSNDKLQSLLKIIAANKDDPKSLLNSESGFDVEKAKSEGSEIMQAVFGSNSQQIVDHLSQKTGIDASQITAVLPMLTAMTTKVMGGKTEDTESNTKGNYLQDLVSLLETNKEGSITDNLFRIGKQLLSKFLSGQK